ncbi:MAG TPA: divalent metal cation transporter [Longimicrobiales bacterium]|nr:divalent metal cation transporter [Longimicrobiales bacterium]
MLVGSLRGFGPGIISGAADDDPAGIATYSIAGAQFGLTLLWLAPVTWPFMAAVQGMCARVGMVTGGGLMDALRQKLPAPLLLLVAMSLFLANTFNIGADLAGMADAAEMLTHIDSRVFVVAFGIGIAAATVGWRYATIAHVLKWLVLSLAAYMIAAISLDPDWREVARATALPAIPRGSAALATIVAILGTTISPYLFFWQASEEVEEEKSMGRATRAARTGASRREIRGRDFDVAAGTLASNTTFFFITLTTALTLHQSGITQPETSTEVAAALRPLAGSFATLLYTIGIVGTGLLAIPILAGSAAYALAELFGWQEGMDERPSRAPGFYSIFALSVTSAVLMDFAEFSVVRVLYWSAVINGLLAPFVLAGILAVASDRKIMEGQPSSRLAQATVLITTIAMFAAGAAMFIL